MIKNLSLISALFAILVILTNIITQVLKSVTYDKVPTRVVALIIAVALSVIGTVVYCQVMVIAVSWCYVAGAVVIGFVAAYAAMFGYDNLYNELVEAVKKLLGIAEE